MTRDLAKAGIVLEILVCFGLPLALLGVGFIMTPVWLGMLVAPLVLSEYRSGADAASLLAVVACIVAVVFGILGAIALFRVVPYVLGISSRSPMNKSTKAYALLGSASVAFFCISVLAQVGTTWALLGILPIGATWHMITIAQRRDAERSSGISDAAA